MAVRLTDRLIRSLSRPARGNKITYDTEVVGLGVRVTANGAKSFVLNFRVHGRQRRLTIGRSPDFSTHLAREKAKALKRHIADGCDPMAERLAERQAPTMADLCGRYMDEHLPKKRPNSQAGDRAIIERVILPRFGQYKVAHISHADIDALHRDLSSATPYQANRVIALLSKMFSLAIKWGNRTDNPARGVERNPERKRQRFLSADELSRLTTELARHKDQQAANVIRIILLTGARKGEVMAATWDQFDLGNGSWTKPGATTKQKTDHRVPLSAPARKLLVAMRSQSDGPYLFPGRVPGQPLTDIKKFWAGVCRASEIEDCRIHDLRHTYASILASSGMSLHIVGALLGHTQPSTTARYAHLYDDPLRAATDRVASFISAASDGRNGEVVDLITASNHRRT